MVEQLIHQRQPLATDVEVFQEILHRYTAIDRQQAIAPAFDLLHGIVDQIFAFGMPEVTEARKLLETIDSVSARDALHIAILRSQGGNRIFSFDRGFDAVAGIERIY